MSTQLSILTAILDGHDEALGAYLRAMPAGDESPFASVPCTHNGRWTVVRTDPAPSARFRAGGLPAPVLMTSGTIDNSPQEWLASLLAVLGPRADDVWSHCAGWSSATDKVAFLLAHRVTSMLEFVTWEAPATRVRLALANRRRATSLAVRTQGSTDAEIVSSYREVMDR